MRHLKGRKVKHMVYQSEEGGGNVLPWFHTSWGIMKQRELAPTRTRREFFKACPQKLTLLGGSQSQRFPNFPKSQHDLCTHRSDKAMLGSTTEPMNKSFGEAVVL